MSHTLLLADDSTTIQRVIALTFADEDIRVVSVSDGDRAIATMTAGRPDIVLVDAAMPGRNGYEVAEYMRRTAGLADIPVLLLAGAFEPIDQPRADAAQCAGVLVKPFEPQQVIAQVKALLTRQPGTVAESTETSSVPPRTSPPDPSNASSPAPTTASVDEYFERLDKVFGQPQSVETTTVHEGPSSRSAAASLASVDQPPSADRPAGALLAAAFLALLDAERKGTPLTPTFPATAVPETLVDEITRRVLIKLSDRAARPLEPLSPEPGRPVTSTE